MAVPIACAAPHADVTGTVAQPIDAHRLHMHKLHSPEQDRPFLLSLVAFCVRIADRDSDLPPCRSLLVTGKGMTRPLVEEASLEYIARCIL